MLLVCRGTRAGRNKSGKFVGKLESRGVTRDFSMRARASSIHHSVSPRRLRSMLCFRVELIIVITLSIS